MVDVSRFGGSDGAWRATCDAYKQRYRGSVPPEVLEAADSCGNGRQAYILGYLFALVLKFRAMPINDEELRELAERKITSGRRAFLGGFDRGV